MKGQGLQYHLGSWVGAVNKIASDHHFEDLSKRPWKSPYKGMLFQPTMPPPANQCWERPLQVGIPFQAFINGCRYVLTIRLKSESFDFLKIDSLGFIPDLDSWQPFCGVLILRQGSTAIDRTDCIKCSQRNIAFIASTAIGPRKGFEAYTKGSHRNIRTWKEFCLFNSGKSCAIVCNFSFVCAKERISQWMRSQRSKVAKRIGGWDENFLISIFQCQSDSSQETTVGEPCPVRLTEPCLPEVGPDFHKRLSNFICCPPDRFPGDCCSRNPICRYIKTPYKNEIVNVGAPISPLEMHRIMQDGEEGVYSARKKSARLVALGLRLSGECPWNFDLNWRQMGVPALPNLHKLGECGQHLLIDW